MSNTLNLGDGKWATKEGSLLAYNSENNNYKPLPFTFDRASSATRVNEQGLIETVGANVPRIDYSSGEGSLKLEPSRTNLLQYSEDFSQWNLIGITVTSNSVISPNGSLNASKLVATSGGSNKVIAQSISAGTRTASVFAKKGEFEGLFIGTGTVGAFFNLNTHTFRANYVSSPTSYKIEEYGNGWYRYSLTFTISSSDNLYIAPNDNVSNTLAITGNGANGIYTWGASLEEGSFATSIINTKGSAVTRAAESCEGAGNEQVFNDNEGVLFAEVKALDTNVGINRKIVLGDGSFNNGIEFSFQTTNNNMQFIIRSSTGGAGITMNIQTTDFDVTEFNKIAISYKSNEGKVFVNGSQVGVTDTSVTTPTGINKLDLKFSTSFDFNSIVKDIRVYNTALTDQELAALTT